MEHSRGPRTTSTSPAAFRKCIYFIREGRGGETFNSLKPISRRHCRFNITRGRVTRSFIFSVFLFFFNASLGNVFAELPSDVMQLESHDWTGVKTKSPPPPRWELVMCWTIIDKKTQLWLGIHETRLERPPTGIFRLTCCLLFFWKIYEGVYECSAQSWPPARMCRRRVQRPTTWRKSLMEGRAKGDWI